MSVFASWSQDKKRWGKCHVSTTQISENTLYTTHVLRDTTHYGLCATCGLGYLIWVVHTFTLGITEIKWVSVLVKLTVESWLIGYLDHS